MTNSRLTSSKDGIKLVTNIPDHGFLPEDKKWIETHPNIEPDEFIGSGEFGAAYTVKGNKNLVVKVPKGYEDCDTSDPKWRRKFIKETEYPIKNEWSNYVRFSLDREALIIPMIAMQVGNPEKDGCKFMGLVQPRVKPIGHLAGHYKPTDKELELIRQQLITLSYHNIVPLDSELGVDRKGRFFYYDLGSVDEVSEAAAFECNQWEWKGLLLILGKYSSSGHYDIEKYGEVKPNSRRSK
jgi:hypothetical protein